MKRLLKRILSRKTVVRLAFVLAVLVTLVAILHLVENYRGRKAWESYVSEARGEGRKLQLRELLPPAIPSEQNYAATPLFEEIFAASAARKEAPRPLDFPKNDLKPPSLGKISEPALADLKGWSDHFVKLKLIDAASDDPAADILRGLERYGPRLEELRRAGEKPAAHFPVEWERGFAALMPHLTTLQQSAKLLSLRAMAHLAKGDSAAAYLDVRDGLRLCRALRREPALISGLVRLSVLSIMEQAVWQGLATDRWADAELTRLDDDFRSFDAMEDLRFALSSERAGMNLQMDLFMKMPAREIAVLFGMVEGAPRWPVFFTVAYPKGWLRQNQVVINRMFDDAAVRVDAIEREGAIRAPKNDEFMRKVERSPLRRTVYVFASMLMPAVQSVEQTYLLADARLHQVTAACALQRFKHATGNYPATLEELVPDYLPVLPRDIMVAAPMRYRLEADGRFVMWSVGLNGTDENGKVMEGVKDKEQPDWIWRYPAAQ